MIAHGVYVDGHFLPGSMTYFRGGVQVSRNIPGMVRATGPFSFLQLLLVHFPLLLFLSGLTSPRRTWRTVSMTGFIFFLGILCYEQIKVFKTYGVVGVVLAPAGSWALPVYTWTAYLLLY